MSTDIYARDQHAMLEADFTVQTCWDADQLDLGRVATLPGWRRCARRRRGIRSCGTGCIGGTCAVELRPSRFGRPAYSASPPCPESATECTALMNDAGFPPKTPNRRVVGASSGVPIAPCMFNNTADWPRSLT
jgi:hypothetical protein